MVSVCLSTPILSAKSITTTSSFWQVSAESFKSVTSPLKPHADDIAIVRRQLLSMKKNLRGILLGVTKELAAIASDQINITAVDNSKEMINNVWIGNNSNRMVKFGNWFDLISIASNMDFVIADGVFTVIDRKSQHCLMESVRSVLADDGLFVVRLFSAPEVRESLQHIYDTTTSNFSAFKWRLAHSISNDKFEVRTQDILDKFREVISPSDIAYFGWTKGDLSTIEVYENSSDVLTFVTESIFMKLCEEHGMKIISKSTGSYELSELCPTFVIRKA